MTTSSATTARPEPASPPRPPASRARRILARGLWWSGSLLFAGALLVILYSVYLMWFTSLGTERAQREMAEAWPSMPTQEQVQELQAVPETPAAFEPPPRPDVAVGEAYAVLWFERSGTRIISDDPLIVVEGVTFDALQRGPGHYPQSDVPGGLDNFAVAGHRTTYGAPFGPLDELQEGDTIHVVDHDGVEWVYGYREHRVVQPEEMWVVGSDPLGDGSSTITLTTCHPRHSAAQRLIAWGELLGTARRD